MGDCMMGAADPLLSQDPHSVHNTYNSSAEEEVVSSVIGCRQWQRSTFLLLRTRSALILYKYLRPSGSQQMTQ